MKIPFDTIFVVPDSLVGVLAKDFWRKLRFAFSRIAGLSTSRAIKITDWERQYSQKDDPFWHLYGGEDFGYWTLGDIVHPGPETFVGKFNSFSELLEFVFDVTSKSERRLVERLPDWLLAFNGQAYFDRGKLLRSVQWWEATGATWRGLPLPVKACLLEKNSPVGRHIDGLTQDEFWSPKRRRMRGRIFGQMERRYKEWNGRWIAYRYTDEEGEEDELRFSFR